MTRKRAPVILILGAALLGLPRSAPAAQIFEMQPIEVLEYDPSVRSTAMGGASGAIFWVTDPNYWANPALLGYAEGVRYDDAREQFPVSPFGDIHATARREVVGHGGVGIGLAGRPFDGPGGLRFDWGTPDWLSPPPVDLYEQVRSWSLGVSGARLTETAAAMFHHQAPALTRYFDVAFGYTRKTVLDFPGLLDDHGATSDWGLLARAGAPFAFGGVPAKLEGAYGYSVLNSARLEFTGSVAQRHQRHSVALHVAAGRFFPRRPGGPPPWFRAGLEPLVSLGGAWDTERLSTPNWSALTHAIGGEVALANVLFLRMGRDRGSNATSGYGIALPIGVFGGLRYDRANLDGTDYRNWSVWMDPFAVMRARR